VTNDEMPSAQRSDAGEDAAAEMVAIEVEPGSVLTLVKCLSA